MGKSSVFFSVHCRSVLVLFQKFGAASTPDLNPPPKKKDSKLHLQVGAILGGAVLCGIWYLDLGFSILFLGGVGP